MEIDTIDEETSSTHDHRQAGISTAEAGVLHG
jgi:hypothetical protein